MSQSDSFNSQGGRKRSRASRARRESVLDLDGDTASTRSQTISHALWEYRSKILKAAKLHIVNEVVEEDKFKHIAERTLTSEQEVKVEKIATELCQAVQETLKGASREDDCLAPIHRALECLGGHDVFLYPRKAGKSD